MLIESEAQLRALYGFAKGRANQKVLAQLEEHSTRFIRLSPFMILSTANQIGELDCSPRGGEPGFVHVVNSTTLLIPDAKGNNRLDSLLNIIQTQSVGCLFLIPGLDETLRVNGNAMLSTARELVAPFEGLKNPPKCVIKITISEVFLHCAKALMRSNLWSGSTQIQRSEMPTMGKMLKDQIGDDTPLESQEKMVKRYLDDL